jgi:aldose 1-epimerase
MRHFKNHIVLFLTSFLVFYNLVVNGQSLNFNNVMPLKAANFQKKINEKNVDLYFLKNGDISTAITNYGGRIVSLLAPAKNGDMADVVIGFKSINDYLKATGIYHGAIIGRVAGRINNGNLVIGDINYTLNLNAGSTQLHGGINGFHNQVWNVKSFNDTSLVLTYLSVEGEMGYPGNVMVEVAYALSKKNELSIEYKATTDKPTALNLTNHAFFNLAGEGSGTIYEHLLFIDADYICPINIDKIAIGKNYKVESTPFDFRIKKQIGIGLGLQDKNEQLNIAGGFDHHFVLNKKRNKQMSLAAIVFDPKSGRKMEVLTTEPCVHFFSANFFKGLDIGKMGKQINYRESFALETQGYPYSSDSKIFPSIILNHKDKYYTKTIYRFSVVK